MADGSVIEDIQLGEESANLDELHKPLDKPTDLRIEYLVESSPEDETRKLDEEEKTQLRAVIAGLNWAAREGRPDAAAAASIYAREFPEPSTDAAKGVNAYVEHLKTNPLEITIHPLPEQELRMLTISDSAFDTSGQERSQHGWLFGFTTAALNQGRQAPVSLVDWRSRKLRRKANSSMLCEAIALSDATAAAEWFDAFWLSIAESHFDPRKHLQRRHDLEPDTGPMKTVLRDDDPVRRDPRHIIVMDAKAVYDSASSEQALSEERRAALEIAVIRDSLRFLKGLPRWIPHNYNPADSLTKARGAHTAPLVKLLRTACWELRPEQELLEEMHESKEQLGYTKRIKTAIAVAMDE
jgi:hypothetical protein